ncbi:MAG: hypothetical protein JGK24_32080 [Microcoleus sp. PH2017_29_MFU_D_A]|uniref:hypothetical protein n=1 Tax=unclassified Microcoleus TaxID=2642155 RepID=UPI001D3A6420|nr:MULTISPECIES: hypothetical protein [unclassified Microcoleus]TAE08069.1 MAG: hypothetical protein EAZ94_26635 [Oscillatoriales cyanobacterium]MCC3457738.1 hypothetical protein [Microcoleus sp. PH2017_08_TRC_O_A]MCC3494716.1 hypothetical protein [Microcoleus sp. PH2017_16_JOR_D_A]MCC3500806.1 hypothetical protein [Microcoleus sp. PH2017_15_JOR_U_A]MCC3587748.1 hypothetical protein [Microcoleus sp. PH2017_30_WIL_O_A]
MSLHRRLFSAIMLVTINLTTSVSIGLAEAKETYLTLNSDDSQSFAGLVQQAEDLAALSIAREFQENPALTEVTIIITADRSRQRVPVLRSRVSRSQWQKDSRIEQWTRYFADSQYLLGFRDSYISSGNSGRSQTINVPAPSRPASRQNDPAFRDD